jgi:hypothetical protein
MRRFLIAAVMAGGLIALWAAILPLTAQPAPKPATAHSPALSKALFLCHGPHGIDQTCATALARALVLEPPDTATTRVSNEFCRANPQLFASVDRRD